MLDTEQKRPRLAIGIGARDTDFDAVGQLLSLLPEDCGAAYILMPALELAAQEALTERLAPYSALPLLAAEPGLELQADEVYVLQPGAWLTLKDGRLHPAAAIQSDDEFPIDHLFGALAREFGSCSAAILLAAASTEGDAGLREIKAVGGLTLAQAHPSSAAIQADAETAADPAMIDLRLEVSEIPAALHRFAKLLASQADAADCPPEAIPLDRGSTELTEQALGRLTGLLEARAGFDLRVYKIATVARRVARRIALLGLADLNAYLQLFRESRCEQQALVRDLLISVTDFFRDPEVFNHLRSEVIEPLVAAATPGEAIRVWVPGCATGEEAYSIAIELLEAIARFDKPLPLQIFATDVDREALAKARAGIYSAVVVEQVPPNYLNHYFEPLQGKGYRIRSQVRDCISFAAHDLTKDPPFSRMHLVSCRNLLIYLRPEAQEQVLRTLHFSLQPDGCLLLGGSESVGALRDLYSTVAKKQRIFRKISTVSTSLAPRNPYRPALLQSYGLSALAGGTLDSGRARRRISAAGETARRLVMQARVPPTLIVAESGIVLFMHGELRPYLRFPDGDPRFELSCLVTPDLATRTRAALYRCRRENKTIVAFSSPDPSRLDRTKITATPAFDLGDGTVILSFEEVLEPFRPAPARSGNPDQDVVIEQLEKELLATREDLRNTVEELESSNEELRSSHEESMSMNEELQSANEELEATTEELRSLNEKLTSANTQLREKVDQLARAHDDIANFFASTKIATIFLDENLSIQRFTPAAAELIGIDEADEGRFVGDLVLELLQFDLLDEARQVFAQLSTESQELQTADGRWVTRTVLPYRTLNRRIEGIVVTFVDVSDLKQATERLAVREQQQAAVARLGIRALEDPDIDVFFDQVVREIQQTLQTDFCKILELQPGGQQLLLRAGVGWREGLVGSATTDNDRNSQAGFTLIVSEPVIVEDLGTERRFHGPELLFAHGVTSGMSCVIPSIDGPYGALGVHTREQRAFSREDANFLQAIAAVISGAINRYAAHMRLALERAAAKALAEAQSLGEAVSCIYRLVASEEDIALAELWEPQDQDLVRTELLNNMQLSHAELEQHLAPGRLRIGQGIPGRLFVQPQAAWLSLLQDLPHFSGQEAAQQLGLRSGFAFTVTHNEEPLAVVLFLSRKRLHLDLSFLRSLEGIGRSMGDFAQRLSIERRLRTTLERAPVGIADRSLDGHWLKVNDCFCAITGYNRDELVGRNFLEITHQDDITRESALYNAIRQGRSRHYSLEKRYIRKDGRIAWVNISTSAVLKSNGEPEYSIVIAEDISTRKAAEEELRESEARFRQVLLSSPVPMMIYDDSGRILELSRSWTDVTGYDKEDLPDTDTWLQLAFRERAASIRAVVEEVWRETPQEHHYELDVHTKAGDIKRLMINTVPLGKDKAGRQLRISAAVDVTRQQSYERELLDASRQKDEFIAMLGHELRNPLAAIRGATELLARPDPGGELSTRVQAILQRQTQHMARLLDGLLDLSRLIRGRIALQREALDLVTVVRDLLNDIHPRALKSGLECDYSLPEEPMWIQGDAVRLTQIVDNLLSNAFNYTQPPGFMRVRLSNEGEAAVLRIQDSGDGIEPELLANLFEPFRQGRQSLDRSKGGLGIGLALVKKLVDLHGGEVSAHSAGLGQGAEFVVRLPLTDQRPVVEPAAPSAQTRRRLLFIEDNEDTAEMFRQILELSGYEVAIALTGPAGIELAREFRPEVVFCDLGLPDGVTGYEVASKLRANPETCHLKLIALSGYARPEDKRRCQEAGFDAHLAKPASLDDIERMLQRDFELRED